MIWKKICVCVVYLHCWCFYEEIHWQITKKLCFQNNSTILFFSINLFQWYLDEPWVNETVSLFYQHPLSVQVSLYLSFYAWQMKVIGQGLKCRTCGKWKFATLTVSFLIESNIKRGNGQCGVPCYKPNITHTFFLVTAQLLKTN